MSDKGEAETNEQNVRPRLGTAADRLGLIVSWIYERFGLCFLRNGQGWGVIRIARVDLNEKVFIIHSLEISNETICFVRQRWSVKQLKSIHSSKRDMLNFTPYIHISIFTTNVLSIIIRFVSIVFEAFHT